MRYAFIFAGLLALASPALAADPNAEARKVADAFIAAVNVKDPQKSVAAVMALFTEDAQHIGVFGRVHGKKEFMQILPKAFADPARKAALTSQEAAALDKSTILSISHFDNVVTGPDGKAMTLPLRCTRILVKQKDGSWKIVAEHTSFGPPPSPAPQAKG